MGTFAERARRLLAGLAVALGTALVVPAAALAQAGSPATPRARGSQSEQIATPERLAGTGFEVWQLALLGAVCLVIAVALFRGSRAHRSEMA